MDQSYEVLNQNSPPPSFQLIPNELQLENRKVYNYIMDQSRYVQGTGSIDDFICSICLNIAWNPVSACSNEHFFCKECIEYFITKSLECPLCKSPIHISESQSIKNKFENIQVKCINYMKGCQAVLSYYNIQNHERQCPNSKFECYICSLVFRSFEELNNHYCINELKTRIEHISRFPNQPISGNLTGLENYDNSNNPLNGLIPNSDITNSNSVTSQYILSELHERMKNIELTYLENNRYVPPELYDFDPEILVDEKLGCKLTLTYILFFLNIGGILFASLMYSMSNLYVCKGSYSIIISLCIYVACSLLVLIAYFIKSIRVVFEVIHKIIIIFAWIIIILNIISLGISIGILQAYFENVSRADCQNINSLAYQLENQYSAVSDPGSLIYKYFQLFEEKYGCTGMCYYSESRYSSKYYYSSYSDSYAKTCLDYFISYYKESYYLYYGIKAGLTGVIIIVGLIMIFI